MQSRMNKAQAARLTELGFVVRPGNRLAQRRVGQWEFQQISCRRSGWRWSAQEMQTYKMLGSAEGLPCPLSALVHAEVEQWRTT